MRSTTTAKTLEKLHIVFANFGLPEEIVSDNGPQFSSHEFAEFMKRNLIKHIKTPPYHPASNGAAERVVQTTKKALLKQVLHDQFTKSMRSLQEKLSDFLMAYRNMPSTVTKLSPSELFLKRQPRIQLSLLKPNFTGDTRDKQSRQKQTIDLDRAPMRSFTLGDNVFVTTAQGQCSWEEGVVVKVVSPVIYLVQV